MIQIKAQLLASMNIDSDTGFRTVRPTSDTSAENEARIAA